MVRRLLTSRWLKPAFLALSLGFCGYGLAAEQAKVREALHHLAWGPVIAALAMALLGMGCTMLSWRELVRDLGSPLPLRAATRILFIAQLGKYLPGGVWAPAAQVELGREYQIPRSRSAAAALVNMVVTLGSGLLVAAVALPLSSGGAVRTYWWALALGGLALAGLYPPLTSAVLNRGLRLLRRAPLERGVSGPGIARAVAWGVLGWLFFGAHAWLLVSSLTGKGVSVLLVATGAFALAWSVGFILVFFPGGIGPRELALIAALAPVMPAASAIVVAVISRLVMTAGDLAWAATAFMLGYRGRKRGLRQPVDAGVTPGPAGDSPGKGLGREDPAPRESAAR